ncbi:hypothetical protein [Sphingobacterium sp. WOUb80]|uniref:hypothetical protein n=1 Tax=Sphingobacterium sp. WOUb80 TaxID=3234028 RepID=UPI003CEE0467
MNKQYKIASKLYFASAAIGSVNALLSYEIYTLNDWIMSFMSVLLVVGIGILVSKGYEWVKYVLLLLILISLDGFQFILQDLKEYPVNGILSLLLSLLQIIAIVILFIKKPFTSNNEQFE